MHQWCPIYCMLLKQRIKWGSGTQCMWFTVPWLTGKVVPVLKYQDMKTYEVVTVQLNKFLTSKLYGSKGKAVPLQAWTGTELYPFVTSALEGSVWLASRPGRFTPAKDPVPTVQEAGWAPGPVRTCTKNLAPIGIQSPDRPARSQSLYQLSYPVHSYMQENGQIHGPAALPVR
jgi:hypothetical protein